jgi:hypothetical protein
LPDVAPEKKRRRNLHCRNHTNAIPAALSTTTKRVGYSLPRFLIPQTKFVNIQRKAPAVCRNHAAIPEVLIADVIEDHVRVGDIDDVTTSRKFEDRCASFRLALTGFQLWTGQLS